MIIDVVFYVCLGVAIVALAYCIGMFITKGKSFVENEAIGLSVIAVICNFVLLIMRIMGI